MFTGGIASNMIKNKCYLQHFTKQTRNILDSLHLQTSQGTEMIEAEACFLQDFSKHVCKKSFGALH